MAFELKKGEPIPRGVRRVVSDRINRALAAVKSANGTISDKSVHDVRKRFKEIRGTLRLVRNELGEKTFQRENRGFRDAGRPLSMVRDAKVLVDSLEKLIKHSGRRIDPTKLAWLREELESRRLATRQQTVERNGAVDDIVKQLKTARQRMGDWPLERRGWKAIKGGLSKVYKRGREAMDDARPGASDEALHEWRKRTKDLRYELELLAPMAPRTMGPLAKQAKDLTDLLGDDHDLSVLAATARETARPDVAWFEKLIHRRRGALQKDARALGRKLYRQRPRDFMEQMQRVWKSSRARARAAARH